MVTVNPQSVQIGWLLKASPEISRGFKCTGKNDELHLGSKFDAGSLQGEEGAEIAWRSGSCREHSIACSTKAEDILKRSSSSTATLLSGQDVSAIIGAAFETGYRCGRRDSYDSLPEISHSGNSATSFSAMIKECFRYQAANLLVSVGTRAACRAVRSLFAV